MAPIKKRTSMRARTASKSSTTITKPTPSTANPAISASDVSSLKLKKQDKRHLKHAALMHKVRDASVSKSSSAKRRRPGKKMAATESLGGLRDALPEMEEDEEWEGLSDDDQMAEAGKAGQKKKRRRGEGDGKIKMRSLKHRPGAMKRKQVLEKKEQERFARNLAQLAGNEAGTNDGVDDKQGKGGNGGRQAQKWAALREFLGGTMERDKAFGRG